MTIKSRRVTSLTIRYTESVHMAFDQAGEALLLTGNDLSSWITELFVPGCGEAKFDYSILSRTHNNESTLLHICVRSFDQSFTLPQK